MKNEPAAAPLDEGVIEPHRTTGTSPYVWGLDLIRFAAAVMVVLFHLSWKSNDPDIAFAAGWVGVEIFFVISGFVIMGSASGANVPGFAQKRFARLYPAAIVCAVINVAVLIPFDDLAARYGLVVSATPGSFLASLLLIKGPFLVGALWTLPIELGFYVLMAALIWRGWIRHPSWIGAALILWSGLYLVPFCLSQYGLLPFSVRPLGYGILNLTMLRHGCFFGVGILLWLAAKKRASGRHYVMLALGIALCWVEIAARVVELRAEYAYAVDAATLGGSALATFSVAVIGMWVLSRLNDALRLGSAARLGMRYLGLVTYPLYLLHEGVGGVAFSLLQENGYGHGLALLAGFAFSLAASWVVVIALEPWLKPRLTAIIQEVANRSRFRANSSA